jgi:MerR family mercuric resistance operon transcriptional regulator
MTVTELAIGATARRTGVPIETIRYYERIGLIAPPARNGTYRAYRAADIARLSFIRRARELGFTIEAIRALLGIAGDDRTDCAAVQSIGSAHLADIRARIADLAAMEAVLSRTIAQCGAGDGAACPLIEALSVSAHSPDNSRRR